MLASKEINTHSSQPASVKANQSVKSSQSAAVSPFIQTKLKIGAPGGSFEREADSMADHVISGFGSKGTPAALSIGEAAPTLQKMDSEEEKVMKKASSVPSSASQNLHTRLSSSKGQGAVMSSDIRTKMESGFNADFSNVRIHTGSSAVQMSRDIGARAFTYGSDIYFNQSEYKPDSKGGQHLLAHELTHTIQQGAVGSQQNAGPSTNGLQRKTNGRAPRMIQMVPTAYGDFDTIKYNDITTLPPTPYELGVQMHLKFTPNNKVDATSIGLTQIATGTQNGTLIDQGIYGRRTATSGAGQGHFIDRLSGHPSPIYSSKPNPKAGGDPQDMNDYDTNAIRTLSAAEKQTMASNQGVTGVDHTGSSKLGHRYMKNGRVVGPVDAELYDAPMLTGARNDSEQVFETTALAMDGIQQGRYYGSVEWGWRRDSAGTFTRLPLRVISEGVPSNNFMTAALIWNNATENIGRSTSQAIANAQTLAVSGGAITPVAGVTKNVPDNTTLTILAQATSGGVLYYAASVTIGGSQETVLIPVTQTKQVDVGRPTVDLPIVDVFIADAVAGAMLNRGIQGATETHLAQGTRIRETNQTFGPFQAGDPRINMVEVEVVQGPHTGKTGYLYATDFIPEVKGTR